MGVEPASSLLQGSLTYRRTSPILQTRDESLVFQLHLRPKLIYGEGEDTAVRDFNKCREHCMGKVLLSQ